MDTRQGEMGPSAMLMTPLIIKKTHLEIKFKFVRSQRHCKLLVIFATDSQL